MTFKMLFLVFYYNVVFKGFCLITAIILTRLVIFVWTSRLTFKGKVDSKYRFKVNWKRRGVMSLMAQQKTQDWKVRGSDPGRGKKLEKNLFFRWLVALEPMRSASKYLLYCWKYSWKWRWVQVLGTIQETSD